MGLFGALFKLVAFILLAAIGLGAYLYFVDYGVEATVVDKGQDSSGDTFVILRPKPLPFYDIQQPVDSSAASFVCEGYQVQYHVQSGHYLVRDQQGRLVYDSEEGLTDAFSPIRCAGTDSAGGGGTVFPSLWGA